MSTPPLTRSAFTKWKKSDLIDLADKLKLGGTPNSARKQLVIEHVENYLRSLPVPLSLLEYPELEYFYEIDPVVGKSQDAILEEPSAISATVPVELRNEYKSPENKLEVKNSPEGQESYNNLQFAHIDQEKELQRNEEMENQDPQVGFKFQFEEYLSDIVENCKRFNEEVQDRLSSISAVDTILYLIEVYCLITFIAYNDETTEDKTVVSEIFDNVAETFTITLFQCTEMFDMPCIIRCLYYQYVTPLLSWFVLFRVIPSITSYYINFIRYDLLIEQDPMIFNITKALIGLALYRSSLSGMQNIHYPYYDLQENLRILRDGLGSLPLIFGIAEAFLTLYVL